MKEKRKKKNQVTKGNQDKNIFSDDEACQHLKLFICNEIISNF